MSSMTCAEARALTQLRMEGPLDAARALELETHLETCDACREHRDELRALREELRSLPSLELPGDALEAVMARTVGSERRVRPRWTRAPWLAAAASLLLAALLLPWLPLGPADRPAEYDAAELDLARQQLEMVLGVTGRAIERGGTKGVERALAEGIAPVLGQTGARLTERILEESVAPPLERLPLLSSTPIRSATPLGDRS